MSDAGQNNELEAALHAAQSRIRKLEVDLANRGPPPEISLTTDTEADSDERSSGLSPPK